MASPAPRAHELQPSACSSGADKGKATSKQGITCFACSGKEHYSTDSECPKCGDLYMCHMEDVEPTDISPVKEDKKAKEVVQEDNNEDKPADPIG